MLTYKKAYDLYFISELADFMSMTLVSYALTPWKSNLSNCNGISIDKKFELYNTRTFMTLSKKTSFKNWDLEVYSYWILVCLKKKKNICYGCEKKFVDSLFHKLCL